MIKTAHNLVGSRIRHTHAEYGPGVISKACLNDDADDISVWIKFENGKDTNQFSLIKCINKGLFDYDYGVDELNQIILNTKIEKDEKKRAEAKLRKENEIIRRQAARESRRREQKRVEQERKRREQERAEQERLEQERRRREQERFEQERRRREQERAEQEAKNHEEFQKYVEQTIRKRRQQREEWLAAAKKENEQQIAEKTSIYYYLTEEREVQLFVHYTPIANLKSIIENGILSVFDLSTRGFVADRPDEQRFDNRTDCSSFSISSPNYRLFYSKRQNTPYKYAVLIVDPQIVLDLPLVAISYLPDNAASGAIRNIEDYIGLEAARKLFTEKAINGKAEKSREQLGIPTCYPTNPQAEVFIRCPVDPKYIRSIITEDAETANQLKSELQLSGVRVPRIFQNKVFFDKRKDWRFWQTETVKMEE